MRTKKEADKILSIIQIDMTKAAGEPLQKWLRENWPRKWKENEKNLPSIIFSVLTRPAPLPGTDKDWSVFMALGAQYAKAICQAEEPQAKLSAGGKSVTVDVVGYRGLKTGTIEGKRVVGTGSFMVSCEHKPDGAKDYGNLDRLVPGAKLYDVVQIVYVPSIKTWRMDWSEGKRRVELSNGSQVNPLYLATAIASVGSPFRLYHYPDRTDGPILVRGVDKVAVVMPMNVNL